MSVKSMFARRLKELRGSVKQEEFGERIGVSRGSISYYENGTRTADIEILDRICREYDVSADWLLGLTDVRKSSPTIREISRLTGLAERSIDCLMEEKDLSDAYSSSDYDQDIGEHHQMYLNLANLFLESHSELYQMGMIYQDLLEAIEKRDSAMGAMSFSEMAEIYEESCKTENKNRYVLSAKEQAKYCLFLLNEKIMELIKSRINWNDN